MNRQLEMAYTVCRGVARSKAKNFYYAFLALPSEKRNALCAVYAFMRNADDISDDPGFSLEQRREQLVAWSEALHRAAAGEPTDDPVILATADTQQRFKVPMDLFDHLVYGTAMDLDFERARQQLSGGEPLAPYATFEELYRYCYFVASVVGLVCIHIFGYSDPAAEGLAERTGIAFQLTNIIRDVKEDALMGRVYLPQEDLMRFGRAPSELNAHAFRNGFQPQTFKPVLALEAERAQQYYGAAEELLPLIHDDSRPCLWVLVNIYRRLLEKIAEKDYDVFTQKIGLTTGEKLMFLGKGILQVIF